MGTFEDVEIIGMLRTFVKQSLVGMGALKGAPCQILSIVDGADSHVVTFKWVDNEGVTHTSEMTVNDGTNGTDGISPTITVKTSTSDTYILTITDADGSFDTPNLKGSGGGSASTFTNSVSCSVGATSVQLTNPLNSTSIVVEPFSQSVSGEPKAILSMNVTVSTITLTFAELTEATDFICRVESIS